MFTTQRQIFWKPHISETALEKTKKTKTCLHESVFKKIPVDTETTENELESENEYLCPA